MSSPLMALGIKAMAANYAGLQVTGHNIANANVEGYSRQSVVLQTAQGQFTGAGYFGKGVDVASVQRAHNEFLTTEAANAKSLAAMDAARLERLRRLENVFPTGEAGLGAVADEFLGAMSDLASRPADGAVRQVVLARAGELAQRFREAGDALDTLQDGVESDLRAIAAEVNSLASAIATANERIAAQKGLAQPANDLLDERERLLSKLAEHVQVTRIDAEDGALSVFVGAGQSLVLGGLANRMWVRPDPLDASRMALSIGKGPTERQLDETTLGGGTIAGLLRFQNDDLVQGRALVGQLAAGLAAGVNAQQALGLTLQAPLGSVAGAPLFAAGGPRVLAHRDNALPAAVVTLAIVDPAALQASEYGLAADEAQPGRWLLTRRADGLSTSIAPGDVVDGLRIDFGSPAPLPGDRFLLQPVSRAASGFMRLLDDPRDLAAAAPLLARSDPGNLGTVAAAALRVTGVPPPVPGATATISFTDDAGGYAWELRDTSNTLLASGTGSWQPGDTIPAMAGEINGFALSIVGVPRTGDRLVVEPTPPQAMASNNGNALALLALRDAALVGGLSVGDAYAQALAGVGVRVQGTRSASEISTAVAAQAEQARSAHSGVSLDEEAARLIQYQQSYQAAAKVLQIAQSLFEAMLQSAG